MKKKILLGLSVLMLMTVAATSCSDNSSQEQVILDAIQNAETLTYDQVLLKAKEEVGENSIEVYGNSSALVKALEAFTEETGIKVVNNKLGDNDIYNKLFTTIGLNKYVADMVLIQDGNKLVTQMINPGYLKNYKPKDYVNKLDADDLDPTAAVYLNKTFMYNNTNLTVAGETEGKEAGKLTNYITNVWQMAGTEADANHISNVSFKPGSQENVNENFLIMLTSPEMVTKLTAAYKSYYGKDYVKEDKYENIGYKYITEFLANTKSHSSDGTATKDAAAGLQGNVVYANFNKLKDCKEEGVGAKDAANLTTAVIEEDGIEGFGGFVYKMYSMVPRNAKYPYAACALINYILSTDGFGKAWGANLGYYSTNPDNSIANGDKELSWWKQNCIVEDPNYIAENYLEVSDYIATIE